MNVHFEYFPLVSIITVVRNDIKNIEKTIVSVTSQSCHNIEYIVIDGLSTDGTVDVIERFRDKINVFISESDNGVYDAMNKGISLSRGRYVIFMNSGDTFHSHNSIKQMGLENVSNYNTVVYGNVSVRYWDGVYVEKPHEFFNTIMKFKGIGICHQSMFFPGKIIRKMSYDLKYKIAADYDMAYKMWKSGVNFLYCDVIVADYDWGNGISSNPRKLVDVYVENARVCNQLYHPLFWAKVMMIYAKLLKEKIIKKNARNKIF